MEKKEKSTAERIIDLIREQNPEISSIICFEFSADGNKIEYISDCKNSHLLFASVFLQKEAMKLVDFKS